MKCPNNNTNDLQNCKQLLWSQTFLSILLSSGLASRKAEKADDVTDALASCDSIHFKPVRSRSTRCVKLANDAGSRLIALLLRCNLVNSLCCGNASGSSSIPVWLAYSSCSSVLETTQAGSLNNGLPERLRTCRDFIAPANSSGKDASLLKDRLRNVNEPHLPMAGGRVCIWLWSRMRTWRVFCSPTKSSGRYARWFSEILRSVSDWKLLQKPDGRDRSMLSLKSRLQMRCAWSANESRLIFENPWPVLMLHVWAGHNTESFSDDVVNAVFSEALSLWVSHSSLLRWYTQ